MLSQSKTEEAFDSTLKDIIIPQREKPGYIYQKEDTLQNDLQKETTVVGVSPLHYKENTREIL